MKAFKFNKFNLKKNIFNKYIILFSFLGGSDSNKGKSKKWKKILQFPHISQCVDLKPLIGTYIKIKINLLRNTNQILFIFWCNFIFSHLLDMRYSYIIDQQPIGRLLFLQFCEEERQEFHRYNVFLDSIVSHWFFI